MGYLKDIHSNLDIQAFPGAHFEIAGDVPTPQCSEALIEGTDATTETLSDSLIDPEKFRPYFLDGKFCTITDATPPFTVTLQIILHSPSILLLAGNVLDATNVHYYVHDGGELILTRNAKSFAQFIHAAGYAYTIKGGKLYTNMPSQLLKNACTILFDPLT